MAIDLKGWGWVTPPQNYNAVYSLSDNIRKEKQGEQERAEKMQAQNASMSKFLTNYLDPKDHLSGSPYDPVITKGFSDILQEGISLMNQNKGMTTDMLLMALSPKVGKLAEYAQKAKVIKQNIDKRIGEVGENSGYDKAKLGQLAREGAFYDENGVLKPLETVDPSIDYVKETVAKRPYDVTTNKVIDDWVKGIDKNVQTTDIVTISPTGGRKRTKVKVTAPTGFVPDVDESGVATKRFVPQYENAFDNGKPIMHEFEDASGKKTKAQVRLLDRGIYNRVLGEKSGAADWVRGQVMLHIKEYKDANGNEIDINSPQSEMVARAILYDELKSRNAGSMEEIIETKAPQIKITNNSSSGRGGAGSDVEIRDIYNEVDKKLSKGADLYRQGEAEKMGLSYRLPLNELSAGAQKILLGYANSITGRSDFAQDEIFVRKDKDGSVNMVYASGDNKDKVLAPIDFSSLNLPANVGIKAKTKVISEGNRKGIPIKAGTESGTKNKKTIKGWQ